MGAEFGDDKASASDSSLSSSRLSCVDRAERNSRALSLHNSITKSKYCIPGTSGYDVIHRVVFKVDSNKRSRRGKNNNINELGDKELRDIMILSHYDVMTLIIDPEQCAFLRHNS